jgi:DNA-binding CsgD family transcriptional regulator
MICPSLEQLRSLTARERQVYDGLFGAGSTETVEDVADRLDISVDVVIAIVSKCRRKLGALEAVRRREAIEWDPPLVVRGRSAHLAYAEHETPLQRRERMARELAEGTRCKACWLLKPCACAVPQGRHSNAATLEGGQP